MNARQGQRGNGVGHPGPDAVIPAQSVAVADDEEA
jgi:hypothetical protein